MDQRTELSEFLRSRRARLQPEDVGLPDHGGRRRVPGLRREELAQLAGVSVAYYTRLEQGRGQNVSTAVLDAISSALRLSHTERDHLTHLVRPVSRRRRAPARTERLRPALQQLVDAMEGVPAYVVGRRLDILGWNRLGLTFLGDLPNLPREHHNLAWLVFLDPASRELYADWERKAADVVATLRLDAGHYPDDPKLASLIGELSMKSEDFRRLWATHDVQEKSFGVKQLHHPVVGPLTLSYEMLALPGDSGQMLITYHAEPGSTSAESLRLLASWSATEAAEVAEAAGAAEPAQDAAPPGERSARGGRAH